MSAVQRVTAGSAVQVAVDALRLDGAVVVEGLLAPEAIACIDRELEPHVQERAPGFRPGFDQAFYGGNTKRIQALVAKSPTFASAVLVHPVLLGICDEILGASCGNYWLSQAETIFIGPGEPAQVLHRDDENWSFAQRLGIPLQVSVLVALGNFDEETGATRVLPRSHQWDLDEPFDRSVEVGVSLQPGDALIYLGSTVHGGGANTTSDSWRRALYAGFLVGWLTPEESVALSIPENVLRGLPERARALVGWSSLDGNRACSTDGSQAALGLWQMDSDVLERHGGLFSNR